MIRKYLTTVAVFYAVFFSQRVTGQEVTDFGKKLIDSRRAITSYHAKIELHRTIPQEILTELVVAGEGDRYRLDRKRIKFSINRSIEGYVDRRARLKGVVKKNHSVYGAKLDYQEKERDGFLELRGLGMHIIMFANQNPEKYTLDKSFVQNVLSNHNDVEVKEIRDVSCLVATRVEREDRKLSIFFEEDSGRYRGCEIVDGDGSTAVWISAWKKVSGIEFPTELKQWESTSGVIDFEESVNVTELKINTELPRDTFEFSGLGVTLGQEVEVRSGPGSGEIADFTKMYWNGTKLVNSKLLVQTTFWDAPKIIGLLMILFGVFIGASILRKRRAR